MEVDVLHEDRRFLVVCKPAGLLSVPAIDPAKRHSVRTWAEAAYPGARIVHRLDRDASGVMVVARDAEAHRDLSIQFQERRVAKEYVAVVAGAPDADRGTVDLPIAKAEPGSAVQQVDPERGRAAVTHWEVLERTSGRTSMLLRPVTGRAHQLRVHMLALGHPILGDELYGPPEVVAAAERLLLHATSLEFDHPGTGERCAFASAPPW